MHHELPNRLDLNWYRAQAKALLRAYRSGDQDASERFTSAIGSRPRISLVDAQHVIALEHGYARWGDFKAWLETRREEPPVGRIGRAPVAHYERRASELGDAVAAGDVDALRRVRAHVPRLTDFAGGELSPLDARLVVAREYGFPTWRDLVFYVQKAIDEHEHHPSGALAEAFDLIRAGNVDALRSMLDRQPDLVRATYRGAAATMLEAVAQPGVFGENLGVALGIDRRIVELLIERGSALDTPLNLAACFNRAEFVGILLGAGADATATEIWGITPLQTALYHGSREAADLLADVALVPDALYIAAGAGAIEAMRRWFDTRGLLRPDALRAPRPNLADVGWPPGPPPLDTAQAVLDEAFALAAFSGRLEAMQWLLDRGASVDGAVHLGLTALHLAVIRGRIEVVEWLVGHGANISLQDGIHHRLPLGWAEHAGKDSPIATYLRGRGPSTTL
jgi:hypothetical protein